MADGIFDNAEFYATQVGETALGNPFAFGPAEQYGLRNFGPLARPSSPPPPPPMELPKRELPLDVDGIYRDMAYELAERALTDLYHFGGPFDTMESMMGLPRPAEQNEYLHPAPDHGVTGEIRPYGNKSAELGIFDHLFGQPLTPGEVLHPESQLGLQPGIGGEMELVDVDINPEMTYGI